MQRAFTLIELSIVLVIIGLIVGGVLVGRDLIRAAELRKTASDFTTIDTAINTFRLKYNGLPGDLTNAYSFFSSTGCTNADVNTTTAGCNGNGNKIWNSSTEGHFREVFRAWQQLGESGLYPGSFTGVAGSAHARDMVIGENVPASAIKGGGYGLRFEGAFAAAQPWWFEGYYGNMVLFGADGVNEYLIDPLLVPIDALSLDTKIDDGRPGTGKLRSFNTDSTGMNCSDTDDKATAVYRADLTTKECAFSYSIQ